MDKEKQKQQKLHKSCILNKICINHASTAKLRKSCIRKKKQKQKVCIHHASTSGLHKSCIYTQSCINHASSIELHKSCIFSTLNQSCTEFCINHAYINHFSTLPFDLARHRTFLDQLGQYFHQGHLSLVLSSSGWQP